MNLLGAKIIGIKKMNEATKELNGYDGPYDHPLVIILDNGISIWAQQDEENNGPGCLVYEDKEGNGGYVEEE